MATSQSAAPPSWRSIPIPERMQHLKLDARGYPIPCMVMVDANGLPHFAINNEEMRIRCVRQSLCSICGGKLNRGRWWVGGTLSAFHKHGAFIDPPMHFECSHYALQVCPYLAAPRYAGEIGLAKLNANPINATMIVADNTMMPGRPEGDLFAAVMAVDQIVFENYNTKPLQYRHIEYWRHGQPVSKAEGEAITKEALAKAAGITAVAGPTYHVVGPHK